MTTPGLPNVPSAPTIIPRQPGETVYAYRNRRSLALTGETLYQRRIRKGQAGGLTRAEARGHRTVGGVTEYQRRRAQTLNTYGKTPWELWRDYQVYWLNQNGFTPQTTGWSWSKLIQAAPWLRYLNEHASPGGQMEPGMLLEATDMEATGVLESEWGFARLQQRYEDTREYVELRNKTSGNWHWFHDRIPELPAQWWYYH